MRLSKWFQQKADCAISHAKNKVGLPFITTNNPETFKKRTGIDYLDIGKILLKDIRWLVGISIDSPYYTDALWTIKFHQFFADDANYFELNFNQDMRTAYYSSLYPLIHYAGDGSIFLRNVLKACQKMNIRTLSLVPETLQSERFFRRAAAQANHPFIGHGTAPAAWPFESSYRFMMYDLQNEQQMQAAMDYLESRTALSIARAPRTATHIDLQQDL